MRALISNDTRLTRLHELVNDHPDFEHVSVTGDVYCFRYVPHGLGDCQEAPEVRGLIDQLNQEIAEAVLRNGTHLLMRIGIHKRVALRMSICRTTLQEDVDATFEAVARWGRLITKTHFVNYEQLTERETSSCSSEFCSSRTESLVT